MTVTLDLPPEIERAYLAEAQPKGVLPGDPVGQVTIARDSPLPPGEPVFE